MSWVLVQEISESSAGSRFGFHRSRSARCEGLGCLGAQRTDVSSVSGSANPGHAFMEFAFLRMH